LKQLFKSPDTQARKGRKGWGFWIFPALLLGFLVFFPLFLGLPGEARERIVFFGDPAVNATFEKALQEAWEASFPDLSLGNLEPFPQGASSSVYLSLPSSSEELFLGVLSLRQLAILLPEALTLGTPFLFYSSGAVELFFEQSRYWELLRERFQEVLPHFLAGPAEGGDFLAVLDSRKALGDPLHLEGTLYGASWEAEAAVLYGFGAKPLLLPSQEILGALLQGTLTGCMLPLENLESPFWEDFGISLFLSSGLYDLQFLVLSQKLRERLGEEGLSRLEAVQERANRKVREDRVAKITGILERFEKKELHVQELSLKEQAPFAVTARTVYRQWLETKISRNWIDLPLQEAQDANSMAGGQ